MRELPIGVSNYRKLIEYNNAVSGEGYLFVDKSLFIREILADGSEVVVITRPRRFGKTMNLSMLECFFAEQIDNKLTKGMFDGLAISKCPDCMQHQGQYPVIFLSLKGIKGPNFEYCMELMQIEIQKLFGKHRSLLLSDKLNSDEKEIFQAYLNKKNNLAGLSQAVAYLSLFIHKVTNIKPYFLLDEYDTAIQEAYSRGFYKEMIDFMRGFFSSSLKDNNTLGKAVLTGILRVSKESLFADLNNVKVYSMFHERYADKFGFTESEVDALLQQSELDKDREQVKAWFNGYQVANQILYNPWSIVNCLSEGGALKPFWINTSGNDLIRRLIITSEAPIKDKFARLVSGKSIKEIVDEHVVFSDLETNKSALWSLFFMSGYLKVLTRELTDYGQVCELQIPNKEISFLFKTVINQWLAGNKGITWYIEFLDDLTLGKTIAFEKKLQTLIEGVLSYHDQDKHAPELFYHGLTLGLTAGLTNTYEIKSNRESGHGRFDLAFFPKNKNSDPGIIIEFKAPNSEALLEEQAKEALAQIDNLDYAMEMRNLGINHVIKMGIAFHRKAVKVVSNQL